jgi:hypothetical protein
MRFISAPQTQYQYVQTGNTAQRRGLDAGAIMKDAANSGRELMGMQFGVPIWGNLCARAGVAETSGWCHRPASFHRSMHTL